MTLSPVFRSLEAVEALRREGVWERLAPAADAQADAISRVKQDLPLILDAYQPFLRELRPEDLAGSAAVFRIKEEMLVRASQVAGAGTAKDILIQDLVQQ